MGREKWGDDSGVIKVGVQKVGYKGKWGTKWGEKSGVT